MIELTSVRYAYPENHGLHIDRKTGLQEYTFLHFYDTVQLEYQGRWIETAPHAVIVYDRLVPQHFKTDRMLTHDWFHFRGDLSEILADSGLELNKLYYPARYDDISRCVLEIEEEFYGGRPGHDRMARLKTEELFILLGRAVHAEAETAVDQKTIEKLRHLRGRVFSSLGENWSVIRMAEQISFSESRFYSIYKEVFGITPLADLIKARVNSAENMLLFGQKSVAEIASELGYQNTTHFIRQFKKFTGLSPALYRKRYRG